MSSAAKSQAGALVRQPVRVKVLRKGQPLMELVFQSTPIRIGRLNDNDIVLPFDFVSRYHCEIRFDGTQWIAVDLGSKNGLMLDATTRAQEIHLDNGSEFAIQEISMVLVHEEIAENTSFGAIREADTVIGAEIVVEEPVVAAPRKAPTAQEKAQTQVASRSSRSESVSHDRSSKTDSRTDDIEASRHGHEGVKRPILDLDQEQLLFIPHPMIHQARERAVQMIVLWHDIVIDAREFGVGRSVTWDWQGETIHLGTVKPEKCTIKVPRGCHPVGSVKGNQITLTLSEPNAFRASEVLRVSFRFVPKSRDLAPASIWPEQRLVNPLLVSSTIHGAAVLTTLLLPDKPKLVERKEPERFASIIVAPTPPPIALQPTPTPTPAPTATPTPVQVAKKEEPEPTPTPKARKVVEKKKLRKVAELKKEEPVKKAIEKPVVKPEVKVAEKLPPLKEKPVPAVARVEKPAPAATPVFNAKAVGALKMLDLMKAGPATKVANIENIQVSRAPASVAGTVMGREAVEGTGDMISKLNQSATGGGTGKGDGVVGVALGGKGAGGSYQTAGLSGKAGKSKVRGTVVGGASYTELSKSEGLTRKQVMDVVNKHQAQIQACYERALMKNADIVGRADFEWQITPKGSVSTVAVKETTIKNGESLLECVKGVFAGMKFPESSNGEGTTPTIGLPFGRL